MAAYGEFLMAVDNPQCIRPRRLQYQVEPEFEHFFERTGVGTNFGGDVGDSSEGGFDAPTTSTGVTRGNCPSARAAARVRAMLPPAE